MRATSGLILRLRQIPAFLGKAAVLLLWTVLLSVCTPVTPSPEAPEPEPAEPTFPVLEEGALSSTEEAEAARLLGSARDAFVEEEFQEALQLADRIVSEFPAAPGSGEGLWILARSAFELGQTLRAAEAAGRLIRVLPPDGPLEAEVRLLEGRARIAGGEEVAGTAALLRIPRDPSERIREEALVSVRRSVQRLSDSELLHLIDAEGGDLPEWGIPIRVEHALALHREGDRGGAARVAERALEDGARGPDRDLARALVDGDPDRVDEAVGVISARIGALFLRDASPSERNYAELIREGVRVRLEGATLEGRRPVRTELDEGRAGSQELGETVRELESQGVLGVVGPLTDDALEAAARARSSPVPLISPTARRLPSGVEGVYSMGAPDPTGSRHLAAYARSIGLETAVVLRPRSMEEELMSEAFSSEFRERGGRLLRELTYPPGTTSFGEPIQELRRLRPQAVFLPLPLGDVELLAPQLTFHGADTLGIQVLGGDGWTSEDVLQRVDPRHTDGVVAFAPLTPGEDEEEFRTFVEDYESILRKTLRSRVPALGYDAAGLLLESARRGAGTPAEMARELEGIEGFRGATGILRVQEGRILRGVGLVRLRDRAPIPIDFDPNR